MIRRALYVVAACALLAGCAPRQPAAPAAPDVVLFSGTLQELAPHHDGDHFVYRTTSTGQPDRLSVEHLTVLDQPGEFAVNMTEDGVALGKIHLRDDGSSVTLISEGMLREGVLMLYEVPLPSLSVPLHSGESKATSPVTLSHLSDGKLLGYGQAEQTVTARRVTASAGGDEFEIHIERTIELPKGSMHLSVTTWITPGVGETRSQGNVDGGVTFRRELICATVGGKRVGDCAGIMQKGQKGQDGTEQ
jgi:hypothetical protein